MKKTVHFLITSILILVYITPALAIEHSPINASKSNSTAMYIDNISNEYYAIISIEEEIASNTTRTISTKTGKKTYTVYNNDSEVAAQFVLTGTYTYNGNTSSCTGASYSTSVYDDNWKFTSASTSKLGAVASGQFTVKHYSLSVNNQTVSKTITLTCDAKGNLS